MQLLLSSKLFRKSIQHIKYSFIGHVLNRFITASENKFLGGGLLFVNHNFIVSSGFYWLVVCQE